MPKDKDLKRLVRARIAETGERYTQAKAAIDTRGAGQPQRVASRYRPWIEALGNPDTLHDAYRRLRELPAEVLRPLAVAGTRHANWRVRRGCCRLLDDLAFTDDSFAALENCLDDPDPRVRRAALHSLSCAHCKPDGCTLNVREVLERGAQDPNRRVREMAIGPLTWQSLGREPWAVEVLQTAATSDSSDKLRHLARGALERLALMERSNRERQELPPRLREKTERHRGKWVAIAGDGIIGVGGGPGQLQRAAQRQGIAGVRVFWVEDR